MHRPLNRAAETAAVTSGLTVLQIDETSTKITAKVQGGTKHLQLAPESWVRHTALWHRSYKCSLHFVAGALSTELPVLHVCKKPGFLPYRHWLVLCFLLSRGLLSSQESLT